MSEEQEPATNPRKHLKALIVAGGLTFLLAVALAGYFGARLGNDHKAADTTTTTAATEPITAAPTTLNQLQARSEALAALKSVTITFGSHHVGQQIDGSPGMCIAVTAQRDTSNSAVPTTFLDSDFSIIDPDGQINDPLSMFLESESLAPGGHTSGDICFPFNSKHGTYTVKVNGYVEYPTETTFTY